MPSRRCSIESSSSLEKKISDYYRKAYRRYRDSVLKGKRVASVAERQKVERQERDLTEGVSGYRFDMKEGLKPLILGAGTNVLPPDEGLDTLVICSTTAMILLVSGV